MTRTPWFAILAFMALVGVVAGKATQRADQRWDAHSAERYVAAMPGVGQGWIDTLRRIAGPAAVDTIVPAMTASYDSTLAGLFEQWYVRVRLAPRMKTYFVLQSALAQCDGTFVFFPRVRYEHPAIIATPAAVIAHEFGHRFQYDTTSQGRLYRRWRREPKEPFADRFAIAMLALRGWLPENRADRALLHVLRARLRDSYYVKAE